MKSGRILIIENDPLWQELLQESLQVEYELTVVSNKTEAEQALNAAKAAKKPFDVTTVDIGLTSNATILDGEDILALVSLYHQRTKCIVVSGHDQVGATKLKDYFKQFNVFDCVAKANFDLNHFKQVVDAAFYFYGYRLLNELGRSGMGVVYKALDPKHNNRLVALKVLGNQTSLPTEAQARRLARLTQEVSAIRRLAHPNIVKIYDYITSSKNKGQTFLVMEYLDGLTLESQLSVAKRLTQVQALAVAWQLCSALAYAHDQGVIHRDIKPSNIIMLKSDQIKITDFGIAKIMNANIVLTNSEDVAGTLDYMPPEQIFRAKEADHRVDIYATGVILYEILSGQKPYEDPMGNLQQDATPLRDLMPALPASLTQMVMKALARNADERFQTMGQMIQALQAI